MKKKFGIIALLITAVVVMVTKSHWEPMLQKLMPKKS